ncbi:hypothetical protein T484DRAFT_3222922 [Baffinella frigidus]|nr:hypothetical protein T484DRAFT_3222922 [Cryptophyta sp. CCMP2293]
MPSIVPRVKSGQPIPGRETDLLKRWPCWFRCVVRASLFSFYPAPQPEDQRAGALKTSEPYSVRAMHPCTRKERTPRALLRGRTQSLCASLRRAYPEGLSRLRELGVASDDHFMGLSIPKRAYLHLGVREVCVALCQHAAGLSQTVPYRGTSLIRNRPPLGPYSRPTPRALWWSLGGWAFLMSELSVAGEDHLQRRAYPTSRGGPTAYPLSDQASKFGGLRS